MKIACLFPGLGYTCDKPLLYYTGKLLSGHGWTVLPVAYSGFSADVKGNKSKMEDAAEIALQQSEQILCHVRWDENDDILLVSKSIGTCVAGSYAHRHHLNCRHILFTPLESTFSVALNQGIAFHGTSDPWVQTDFVIKACEKAHIPLFITEHANHSLETGNIETDLHTMLDVMRTINQYIRSSGEQ